MNGMTFLQSVAGFAQVGQPDRRNKLAEIDPAYDPLDFLAGTLPRVEFDGEEVLSGKQYAVLGSYRPQPGDRVVMAPVGSTYVIVGKLGEVATGDPLVVFTASGLWTHPPGLTAAWVRVWGAGGAGGGAAATAAGESSIGRGGAAGGYAEKFIDAAALDATETVTIGAGGTAVNGGAGGNGGTSSYGAHVSATGGNGGIVITTTATLAWAGTITAGVGQNGDLNLPGGQDGIGFSSPGLARGGRGGAAALGSETNAQGTNSVDGRAALGQGNGGSGASNNDSEVTTRTGGAGAGGLIVVMNIFAW